MDVALVLDPDQGRLFHRLAAARREVGIELVAQELADALGAVGLFHDQQGGVLGQGLGQDRGPLHVCADDLVRPPLVGHLMGRDIGGVVDLVGPVRVGGEPNGLGIGNGVGEGLGEAGIARELQDPGLPELVGAEVGLKVVQAPLHGGHHALDVPGVTGVVVDREVDALVGLTADGVAGGLDREEVQDRGVGAEAHRPASVRCGVGDQIAGGDRRLAGGGGDRDVRLHPVGVANIVAGPGAFVLQPGGAKLGRQAIFAPPGPVLEQARPGHAQDRRELAIGDEGPVVHQSGGVARVLEAPLGEAG